jgi:amidase
MTTIFQEYPQYDALGLAELVKSKQISAHELLETAIFHIEQLNPQLNAVINKCYDFARKQLSQLNYTEKFCGVPFLLKDLGLAVKGLPFSRGSEYTRNLTATYTSELFNRFEKAGLITLGMTNCPEFGMSFFTEPRAFGPTHNPWDLSLTTGGSSGGAAAAVASRMVPMAHANDGGGSIRVPAACCGLFGLKPSRGRVPLDKALGKGWQGLLIEHVLTRSVRDSAAMLDAIAGSDAGAPFSIPTPARSFLDECSIEPKSLRIGVIKQPIFPAKKLHPECENALQQCLQLCESLQHQVTEINVDINTEELAFYFGIAVSGEAAYMLEAFANILGRKPKSHELEPITQFFAQVGQHFSAGEFAKATHLFDNATYKIAELFKQFDILLTPTLAEPPTKIGHYAPTAFETAILKLSNMTNLSWQTRYLFKNFQKRAYDFAPYTTLFNITGNPAANIPLCWREQSLPLGMQWVAAHGNESLLFQLAAQLERAKPWQNRSPKII